MKNIEAVSLVAVHTHTSKLLENKIRKENRKNIIEISKKDSDET